MLIPAPVRKSLLGNVASPIDFFEIFLHLHKLRRCVSRVHFEKYISTKYTLENTLKIWKLLVIPFRKYVTSGGPQTLFNGPETPTEWKSECDQLNIKHWSLKAFYFIGLVFFFGHGGGRGAFWLGLADYICLCWSYCLICNVSIIALPSVDCQIGQCFNRH